MNTVLFEASLINQVKQNAVHRSREVKDAIALRDY